jgi:hypothetical protein
MAPVSAGFPSPDFRAVGAGNKFADPIYCTTGSSMKLACAPPWNTRSVAFR